jgi:hypothetical protein
LKTTGVDTGKQVQTRSATEGETLPSTTAAAAAEELKSCASKGNRQLVAILVHNLHQSQIKIVSPQMMKKDAFLNKKTTKTIQYALS